MRQTRITRHFFQAIGAIFMVIGSYFGIRDLTNDYNANRTVEGQASSSIERNEPKTRGLEGITCAGVGLGLLWASSRYGKLDAQNRIKNYQPSKKYAGEREGW